MAKSASELVQMAFNLTDGGARCAAGRAVDAAVAEAERQGEAKGIVEKALEDAGGQDSQESNPQEGAFEFTEEKVGNGKVRIGCSFTIDPDASQFAASGEEAAKEDADNADEVDKGAGQAADSAEGLTPVSDELPLPGFSIAEDAVKKSEVKTTAENCKAANVLKCPYHGPEHMQKELLAFFKKNGIVEVDAAVESAGKGKYQVWAICEEDDTDDVKKALEQFMGAAGVDMDKKGVHYNPEDEQTVATFKVDWLDKNAKSNKAMHKADKKESEPEEEDEHSDIGEEAPKKLEPVKVSPEPKKEESADEPKDGGGEVEDTEEEKKVKPYLEAWSQATYMCSKNMTDVGEYDKLKKALDEVNGEPYVEKAIENGKLQIYEMGLDALQTKLCDLLDAVQVGDDAEAEGIKKDIKAYVQNELNGVSFVTDNMKNLGYWSAIKSCAKNIDTLTAMHLDGRVYQFDKLNDEQKADVKKKFAKAAACAELGDMAGAKMSIKLAEKTLKPVACKHDSLASSAVAKAEADAGDIADNDKGWCANAKKLPTAKLDKYVHDVATAFKIPPSVAKNILNGQFAKMKETDFEGNGEGGTQLTPFAFNKLEKSVLAEGTKETEALHSDGIYPVSAQQEDLDKIAEAYDAIKKVAEGDKAYDKSVQSVLNKALGTPYYGTSLGIDTDNALTIAEKLYDATELIGKGVYWSAVAKLHQAQQVMHELFVAKHNKQPIQKEPKKNFDLTYANYSPASVQQTLKGIPYSSDITLSTGYQGGQSMLLYLTNEHHKEENAQKAAAIADAINDTFANVTAKAYASPDDFGIAMVSVMANGLAKEAFNSQHLKSTGSADYDTIKSLTQNAMSIHVSEVIVKGCVGDKTNGFSLSAKDPHSIQQNVVIAEELNKWLKHAKVSILGDEKNGYLVDVKPLAPKMDADDGGDNGSSASASQSPKTFDFGSDAEDMAGSVGKIESKDFVGMVEADGGGDNPSAFILLKPLYKTSPGAAAKVKSEIEKMYPNVHASVHHMLEGGTDKPTGSLYVKLTPTEHCVELKPNDNLLALPKELHGHVVSTHYNSATGNLTITSDSKESAYKVADALNEHYLGLHAEPAYDALGGVLVQPPTGWDGLGNIIGTTFVDYADSSKPHVHEQSQNKKEESVAQSSSPSGHGESMSSTGGKFGGGKAFLQSSVEKYKSSDPTMADKFAKVLAKLYA